MNPFKTTASCILLLAFALLSPGCISTYGPLQIQPLQNNNAVIVPKFSQSYYYFDRDQNLYFIMRGKTIDQSTGKTIEQIVTFRVFWRPVGGKTSMNPTSINATYRYLLITPDSVGLYEGAGFVRLWGKNGTHKLKARIVQGDLRLTQATSNFVDSIGRGRMRGDFSALYNDVTATDMLLAAQQEFFTKSLLPRTAATEPATRPATMPN